jgi:hypothetical protein
LEKSAKIIAKDRKMRMFKDFFLHVFSIIEQYYFPISKSDRSYTRFFFFWGGGVNIYRYKIERLSKGGKIFSEHSAATFMDRRAYIQLNMLLLSTVPGSLVKKMGRRFHLRSIFYLIKAGIFFPLFV